MNIYSFTGGAPHANRPNRIDNAAPVMPVPGFGQLTPVADDTPKLQVLRQDTFTFQGSAQQQETQTDEWLSGKSLSDVKSHLRRLFGKGTETALRRAANVLKELKETQTSHTLLFASNSDESDFRNNYGQGVKELAAGDLPAATIYFQRALRKTQSDKSPTTPNPFAQRFEG